VESKADVRKFATVKQGSPVEKGEPQTLPGEESICYHPIGAKVRGKERIKARKSDGHLFATWRYKKDGKASSLLNENSEKVLRERKRKGRIGKEKVYQGGTCPCRLRMGRPGKKIGAGHLGTMTRNGGIETLMDCEKLSKKKEGERDICWKKVKVGFTPPRLRKGHKGGRDSHPAKERGRRTHVQQLLYTRREDSQWRAGK